MIKAVLFDFDGVVVQSEPLHMKTFLDVLKKYGVKVDRERWYREFAGTGSRHIFDVLTREYGITEQVDELIAKRKQIYEKAVKDGELELTPGIIEFLEKLRKKRIKTAIVSGSDRTNVLTALGVFGLEAYFDLIISGSDIKERKPEPGPFLHAAKKLGLQPGECIAIEDSVSGAKSAVAAGMNLVIIESPANLPPYPDATRLKDFRGFELP